MEYFLKAKSKRRKQNITSPEQCKQPNPTVRTNNYERQESEFASEFAESVHAGSRLACGSRQAQ